MTEHEKQTGEWHEKDIIVNGIRVVVYDGDCWHIPGGKTIHDEREARRFAGLLYDFTADQAAAWKERHGYDRVSV